MAVCIEALNLPKPVCFPWADSDSVAEMLGAGLSGVTIVGGHTSSAFCAAARAADANRVRRGVTYDGRQPLYGVVLTAGVPVAGDWISGMERHVDNGGRVFMVLPELVIEQALEHLAKMIPDRKEFSRFLSLVVAVGEMATNRWRLLQVDGNWRCRPVLELR